MIGFHQRLGRVLQGHAGGPGLGRGSGSRLDHGQIGRDADRDGGKGRAVGQIVHFAFDFFDLSLDLGQFLVDAQGFVHAFGILQEGLDARLGGFQVVQTRLQIDVLVGDILAGGIFV